MANNEFKNYFELHDWYDNLRSHDMTTDLSAKILEKIASASDRQSLKALKDILHSEYVILGCFDKAVALLESEFTDIPDNGLTAITLAEDYFHHLERPEIALRKIETAIQITNRTGHFRRHALNVQARILRALDDYMKLEKCLQQIMATTVTEGQMDIGREGDFINNLPAGAISEDVLILYKKFLAEFKTRIPPDHKQHGRDD